MLILTAIGMFAVMSPSRTGLATRSRSDPSLEGSGLTGRDIARLITFGFASWPGVSCSSRPATCARPAQQQGEAARAILSWILSGIGLLCCGPYALLSPDQLDHDASVHRGRIPGRGGAGAAGRDAGLGHGHLAGSRARAPPRLAADHHPAGAARLERVLPQGRGSHGSVPGRPAALRSTAVRPAAGPARSAGPAAGQSPVSPRTATSRRPRRSSSASQRPRR